MNRKLRKAVTGLLTTSALALASTQAFAVNVVATPFTFNGTGSTTQTVTTGGTTGWSFQTVGGNKNIGWSHATKWYNLSVTAAGDAYITAQQIGALGELPAFTIWSLTGGTFVNNVDGGQHNFNQVRGPSDASGLSASTWLNDDINGTGTPNNVDYIVGYANAGPGPFINADGDTVGNGQVFDSTQSFNADYSLTGRLAATGSTVTTGVDANGLGFAQLFLKGLGVGNYIIAAGGSDWNASTLNTGKAFSLTVGSVNPVAAVPIPGAVWLFGSAFTGLMGWSRRKAATA